MKELVLTVLCTLYLSCVISQDILDFEDFEIPVDSFLNGSDGTGGFSSETIKLPNTFDPEFSSWLGWSVSSITDNISPGFGNQYSAITGGGFDGSQNYAVSYDFAENKIHLQGDANVLDGFYITNNTYTYLSMRDGDSFAKKFGGETGDDPDYFLLTIKAYKNGDIKEDSINFYLADYRFEDNSQDYLIDEWTYVDVSVLGQIDSIGLSLSSSDVGQFGMNTPSYFCIDNISTSARMTTTTTEANFSTLIDIYPNPTSDVMTITQELDDHVQLLLFNSVGLLVSDQQAKDVSTINLSGLAGGIYYVQLRSGSKQITRKIIKK